MKYRLKQIHCRPWVSNPDPVVVYCAHGLHASYMTSGHSGWKALGGAMELQP